MSRTKEYLGLAFISIFAIVMIFVIITPHYGQAEINGENVCGRVDCAVGRCQLKNNETVYQAVTNIEMVEACTQ